MRRPTTGQGRKAGTGPTPQGGRALERVKQDRLARGLPDAPAGKSLTVDDTAPAAKAPRGKTSSK